MKTHVVVHRRQRYVYVIGDELVHVPFVVKRTEPLCAVPETTGNVTLTGGSDCTTGVATDTETLVPCAFVSVSWKRTVRSPAASVAVKRCVSPVCPAMSTQANPWLSQRR